MIALVPKEPQIILGNLSWASMLTRCPRQDMLLNAAGILRDWQE